MSGMSRQSLFQIWDNTVLIFCCNLLLLAGGLAAALALELAAQAGPAAIFAALLLSAFAAALALLVYAAFLDHVLRCSPGAFGLSQQVRRLAPAAALGAAAALFVLSVAAMTAAAAGGAHGIARLVLLAWVCLVGAQLLLFGGVRIACGQPAIRALGEAGQDAFGRPLGAAGALAAFGLCLASGVLGFPGIGGGLILLRAHTSCHTEARGRHGEVLPPLAVLFPWRR